MEFQMTKPKLEYFLRLWSKKKTAEPSLGLTITLYQWLSIIHTAGKSSYSLNYYLLNKYRKVASSNMSCLEAHAGFFRLLMKALFNPYVM